MTSLLHTADIHLRANDDERWRGLEAVLDIASELAVDVVTIGGDLFDRPKDVDHLRPSLRNHLFTDHDFDILLIPGNHDIEAFRDDLFFGDCCTVVSDEDNFATWTSETGELAVVALPYQETFTDELAMALRDRDRSAEREALLFHGSLDAPVGAATGDETAYRYFPVTAEELDSLGFEYVLAGHYHNPHHRTFASGTEFAYPGTPVSTTRAETGRRQVVLLEPDSQLRFESLDTAHYLDKQLTVTPGEEHACLESVSEWVQSAVSDLATPQLTVDGAVSVPETEFRDELEADIDSRWINHEWVSVETVSNHPVIDEFDTRLDERDWDEQTKQAVRIRTLKLAATEWR